MNCEKEKGLSFSVSGNGIPLVLLHGWQMQKETFDYLARDLQADFKVYQIDLPGFGSSDIKSALSIEDYADILHDFLIEHEKNPPIILGHSFGGRVAICYAGKYPVNKLILAGTPGIRKKLSLYRRFKQFLYKKIKKVRGSRDYESAKGLLKMVLVKAVNFDLVPFMNSINCPVLLIWGKKDREVKLDIARHMNKLIKDSELVVIPNCGHFPYLERYRYFLIIVRFYLLKENYDCDSC